MFTQYIALDTSRKDGKHYSAAIELLKNFLAQIGFETQRVPIPTSIAPKGNRTHLVADRTEDTSLPTLVIYNHIDVVPAKYPNAFKLRVKDGKVFGRGACDHKGSTVAVLDALEKLNDQKLRFNIRFLATTDEETDQLEQLRYLTSQFPLPPNSLVFDPDTLAGGVTVATLGLAQLKIKVKGKAVHSGSSHLGINAIEQAAKLIHFLQTEEKPRQESQRSRFSSFPSTGVDQICSRCNVNVITGGVANNVVPDSCELIVDFRFIPEVDVVTEANKALQRIKGFCHQHSISIETEPLSQCDSYFCDHFEADRLNDIYKKITGESGMYGVLGSTHAAQWCKELQLPHFGIGVARGDTNMHGDHEFAYIRDIENLSKTFQEFVRQ